MNIVHWILNAEGNPEPIEVNDRESLVKWGQWFENPANRRIGDDTIGDSRVSTVFLSIDHRFAGNGPPILFETIVFGGPLSDECERYSTRAEAVAGHAAMIERVKAAETAADTSVTCDNCKGHGTADHTCPYKEEINDDSTTLCNCCDDCERECLMDI